MTASVATAAVVNPRSVVVKGSMLPSWGAFVDTSSKIAGADMDEYAGEHAASGIV